VSLFELKQAMTASCPSSWYTYLRYALHLPGRELTLPAGTWLLELEVENDNALYWLADGTSVSLPGPLLASDAKLVDHPEAVRAMSACRTVEQAALEDWAVHPEHVDHSAPFRLIKSRFAGGQNLPR